MARSGDGTRLLAAANDSSGGAVVLDGNGNVISGPQILGSGNVTSLAANSNGSRFGAGPAAGGTSLTIRGSGFQSGTMATLGGKVVTVNFKDKNTLTFTTPALTSGAQQLVLTNPDGESVSLDAAFVVQ